MWYFTWILRLGLALADGILNAIWFEFRERERERMEHSPPINVPRPV